MKYRQDALLQGQVQINQHIAATDQIQMGKRRIAGEVVPRKNAQVPDCFADLVVMIDPHKKTAESILRNVRLDIVEVDSGPGFLQGGVVDVGGQDLDRNGIGPVAQVFQQRNGQGVDFLAGGTAGHPDANGIFRGAALAEHGKTFSRRASNTSASRKKWVTRIRRSWYRAWSSLASSRREAR